MESFLLVRIRKQLAAPAAIVFVAFAFRIFFLGGLVRHMPAAAGGSYQLGYGEVGAIAASLASGGGFSSPLGAETGPTAWTTPVYPLLVAAVFKIFGIFSLHAGIAIRLSNILFSSFTCCFLYGIGKRLFGAPTGTWAAWLWAVWPQAVFFPVMWVWDTSLSALLVSICMWATYALEGKKTARSWAAWGGLWGISVLTNAAILSLFPGSFLFALFRAQRQKLNWIRFAGISALAFSLLLAPWILRNEITFKGKVALRSNFGLELWLGNNPEVPSSWSWWLHPSDSASEKAEFIRLGEVAYMQEKKAAAIQFIKSHPADTVRFQYHRFMETWTGYGDSFMDIWRGASAALRSQLLLSYSLTILMLVGLLLARRHHADSFFPLLNAILFFPLVYYLCHTNLRYRHPIEPVIVLLAAYALTTIIGGARRRLSAGGQKNAAEPDATNPGISDLKSA